MEVRAELYSKIKHHTTLINFIVFCAVKYVWETVEHLIAEIDRLIRMLKELPVRYATAV